MKTRQTATRAGARANGAQPAETWRIMQPPLDAPPAVNAYEPGSWGPEAANALVADHGGWRDPWVAS